MMEVDNDLSAFELLLPEIYEEIFKYLTVDDLKNLFLVSKTISSRASEFKSVMQKMYFNYEGIEDYQSGRKYLAADSKNNKTCTIPQFLILATKFQYLEFLEISFSNLMIDDEFDTGMNCLVQLKTLNFLLIQNNDCYTRGFAMSSTESWTLNKLESLEISGSGFDDLFLPGQEITRKFESILSIKKLSIKIGARIDASQVQVIRCFIASRSSLEELEIDGGPEDVEMLPKYVKLPIKRFTFCNYTDDQTPINCPEFILNCRPTLESILGRFSIATYRVLMKSLKLTEMTWDTYEIDIKVEEIESFETNRSIKFLGISCLPDLTGVILLNALIQKCEALTSLDFSDADNVTEIQSSKITTLELFFTHKYSDNFWNQLKLNFPNIENLIIDGSSQIGDKDKQILNDIANQRWNLKSVRMRELSKISLSSFENLLTNCPNLQTLIFPDDSMKLIENWSDLALYIKLFDDYIKKGLKVYVSRFTGSRTVLTLISSLK